MSFKEICHKISLIPYSTVENIEFEVIFDSIDLNPLKLEDYQQKIITGNDSQAIDLLKVLLFL